MPIGYSNKPVCLGTVLDIPMYESSGTVVHDVSGNQNHGTCTNVAWTQLASGVWVNVFNGASSKIVVPANANMYNANTLSTVVWVKETSQVINKGIMGWITLAGDLYWYLYTNPTDQIRFYTTTSGGASYVNSGTLSTGIWYMVTAIYDSAGGANNQNLYINTAPSTPATITGTIADYSALDFALGVQNLTVPVGFIDGSLALPRIFNRALSTQEIKQIYSSERDLFGV